MSRSSLLKKSFPSSRINSNLGAKANCCKSSDLEVFVPGHSPFLFKQLQ